MSREIGAFSYASGPVLVANAWYVCQTVAELGGLFRGRALPHLLSEEAIGSSARDPHVDE